MKEIMNETSYKLGQIRAIPEDIDETRTVEFIISDETRDRHGTVLKVDRWELKNYKLNPVVGYMHEVWGGSFLSSADPDMIIGKGDVFIEDDKLIGRVTFEPGDINPLAEKIFQKVKFGSIRATSVGFIETKEGEYGTGDEARGAKNETYYYGGQELAEFSIVNIPSNPKAIKRTVKDVYSEQVKKVRSLLGESLTDDDISKLTIAGLIRVLTGDIDQHDNTEHVEEKEIEEVSADIQLRRMRLELNKLK